MEIMKTIYVTVAEYVGNGGLLSEGREIWLSNLDVPAPFKFTKLETGGMVHYVAKSGNSYAKAIDLCYVAISCTPIYA